MPAIVIAHRFCTSRDTRHNATNRGKNTFELVVTVLDATETGQGLK